MRHNSFSFCMYGYLLSTLELLYQEVNGIIVEAQNVPDPEKSCILFFRTVVMFPNTYLAFQILADNFKTLIWQINYWPSLKKVGNLQPQYIKSPKITERQMDGLQYLSGFII